MLVAFTSIGTKRIKGHIGLAIFARATDVESGLVGLGDDAPPPPPECDGALDGAIARAADEAAARAAGEAKAAGEPGEERRAL